MKWYMFCGKYWMIQYTFNWWLSFGVHIDFKRKYTGKNKIPYGPYIDIHFLFFIISFGINPRYSNEYSANIIGRGGELDG